jgi:hypothetical protein
MSPEHDSLPRLLLLVAEASARIPFEPSDPNLGSFSSITPERSPGLRDGRHGNQESVGVTHDLFSARRLFRASCEMLTELHQPATLFKSPSTRMI